MPPHDSKAHSSPKCDGTWRSWKPLPPRCPETGTRCATCRSACEPIGLSWPRRCRSLMAVWWQVECLRIARPFRTESFDLERPGLPLGQQPKKADCWPRMGLGVRRGGALPRPWPPPRCDQQAPATPAHLICPSFDLGSSQPF